MDVNRLATDRDAVSEVIGVILMVAITVILASVIAVVVLGIGGDTTVAPTADFSFDYDPDTNTVTATHTAGDRIRADEVFVRGESLASTGNWQTLGGEASRSLGSQSAISSGDSLDVSVTGGDYVLRVTWEASAGDASSVLATDRGPDA